MITKEQIDIIIKKQLSYECNCDPKDFLKEENIITNYILHDKRRRFSDNRNFLLMVTFGNNTVISADEKIQPWLHRWVKGKRGIWLFEHNNLFELENELRRYGYKMTQTHHAFVPDAKTTNINTNLKVKWIEQNEIAKYYGREEFSNAIQNNFNPERPDVLAVVALDCDEIMGLAGCSADTQDMWQIGVDVMPKYSGRGVAKTLVSLLKDEIFRRGALPYYETSLSNIPSWRIAIACGFIPTWIEIEAIAEKA